MFVAPMCTDLVSPTGVNATVTISYMGSEPPKVDTSHTITLRVGKVYSPSVHVSKGGIMDPRAHYRLFSKDTSVVQIDSTGTKLVVNDRGTDTIRVAVVGVTIGSPQTGVRKEDTHP